MSSGKASDCVCVTLTVSDCVHMCLRGAHLALVSFLRGTRPHLQLAHTVSHVMSPVTTSSGLCLCDCV